ncbi:MAG: hypothetical protein ACJAZ8_000570 [Planctomycetota bacterium]|jgi:hypothetical protein
MLHPHRPVALGSLFAVALLSACSYTSSDSMVFSSGDGSSYAKSTFEDGIWGMTLKNDSGKSIYRVVGELTPGLEMRSLLHMEPGAELTIRQTTDGLSRSLLANPDTAGRPLLTYREAGAVTTFEIEDQAWYADRLQDLFDNSSIGAVKHAEAVLEAEGVEGLIARAAEFESSERAEVCLRAAFAAPDITEQQCLEISDAIWNMGYESSRLSMLEELSDRHKDNSDLTAALIAGLGDFSSSSHRQDAIQALADRSLSEANLIALLDAARDISYDSNRKETLIALAPLHKLEGNWTRELVDAASELDYSSSLQEVIESFAKLEVVTDADWIQLVDATEDISYDSNMAETLESLIARMPNSDGPLLAAINAVENISSSSSQEDVIEALAKRKAMSHTAWAAVAEACVGINSDSSRSDSLIEVLSNAPAATNVHLAVLNAATSISSSSDFEDVLLALAPYCATEPGLGVAIAEASDQLSYESNRADVLVEVVLHCPKKADDIDRQLAACAKATESMDTTSHKELVLEQILDRPKLGRPVLKAVTRALEKVDYESTRARLQERLIKHLVSGA